MTGASQMPSTTCCTFAGSVMITGAAPGNVAQFSYVMPLPVHCAPNQCKLDQLDI